MSNMDDSSTEAVLGSPVTRGSWSTTQDSQNQPQSPPVASSAAHPNPHDQQAYQYNPQTPGQQYLTGYEITPHIEHEDYPTTITDSQDLYFHSQTQTHRPEEQNSYVQTSSSPPPTYNSFCIPADPQTPLQIQSPYAGHQNVYITPFSQPQHGGYQQAYSPHLQQLTHLDYGQSSLVSPRSISSQSPYTPLPLTPAPLYTTFPPLQSNPSNDFDQHQQPQTSVSEPLNRFVRSDEDEAWSPAAQTHQETRKRRISQVDENVEFRDKLSTELDEIEKGGEAEGQKKRKRRRRVRGNGKARGSRSRDKDRDEDKKDRGNGQGRREGMRAA